MYAYIKNGEVKRQGNLPKSWKMKDGTTVSGFHLLDDKIHKQEGWLPVEEIKPSYNSETHYLSNPTYEILEDKVIKTWEVVELPPQEPDEIELLKRENQLRY